MRRGEVQSVVTLVPMVGDLMRLLRLKLQDLVL
jgi:hypothetical protein